MMPSISTINFIESIWIALAVFGVFYSWKLRRDARADVLARHASGINAGRETLAKLLVVTASVLLYVFSVFLLAGLLAAAIPSPAVTSPESYVIQFMLVSVEAALAWMAYYKQHIRHGVLVRDMNSEALRKEAESRVDLDEMIANTHELKQNTEELRLNTESHETDKRAAAVAALALTAEHVESIMALEMATEATDRNSEATDRNSSIRDPESHTRKEDE